MEAVISQIPNSNIRVDSFKNGGRRCSYFLTHAHTDHCSGLSNTWQCGTIHCTDTTKRLLLLKFPNLASCIQTHPVDAPFFLDDDRCRTIDYEEDEAESPDESIVRVTFIDANHVPGSVMVKLESARVGAVLCTGDFRSCASIIRNPHLVDTRFDRIYFDSTFAHPKSRFQSKPEVIAQITALIRSKRRLAEAEGRPPPDVFVASVLGTEELLVGLSIAFSMRWSIVSTSSADAKARRRELEEIPETKDILTSDSSSTQLHIVPSLKRLDRFFMSHAKKYTEDSRQMGVDRPDPVYISPSAMWFHVDPQRPCGPSRSKRFPFDYTDGYAPRECCGAYRFLWSMHSDSAELRGFLKTLRPKAVTGFVTPVGFEQSSLSASQWIRSCLDFPPKEEHKPSSPTSHRSLSDSQSVISPNNRPSKRRRISDESSSSSAGGHKSRPEISSASSSKKHPSSSSTAIASKPKALGSYHPIYTMSEVESDKFFQKMMRTVSDEALHKSPARAYVASRTRTHHDRARYGYARRTASDSVIGTTRDTRRGPSQLGFRRTRSDSSSSSSQHSSVTKTTSVARGGGTGDGSGASAPSSSSLVNRTQAANDAALLASSRASREAAEMAELLEENARLAAARKPPKTSSEEDFDSRRAGGGLPSGSKSLRDLM